MSRRKWKPGPRGTVEAMPYNENASRRRSRREKARRSLSMKRLVEWEERSEMEAALEGRAL